MQFWLRLKGGPGGAGAHLRILLAIASFVIYDVSALGLAIGRWRFFPLAVQVVILVLAVLTRTSNASLLGAIGLIWLFILWRNRRDSSRVWRHIGNGAFIAGVAGGIVAPLAIRSF